MASGTQGYEFTSVTYSDYITINSAFTVNVGSAIWIAPNLVYIIIDITGNINEGETVIGSASNKVQGAAYFAGRVSSNSGIKPATGVVIGNGAVRVYTNTSGTGSVISGIIIVQ